MAILKSYDNNDSIKIDPVFVKKMLITEINSSEDDIVEKYSYRVNAKTGNFKWFENEFDIEMRSNKLEYLKLDFEYTSLLLTIVRMNNFFKSDSKTMVSVLSSELDTQTPEIISKEALFFALTESTGAVFVYLKKIDDLVEHHLIFSSVEYRDYHDIVITTTKKNIIKFYKTILEQTNRTKSKIIPEIIVRFTPLYDGIIDKFKIVNYEDIIDIKDEFFELEDVKLSDYINDDTRAETLMEYVDFISDIHAQSEYYDSEDYDGEEDFDDEEYDFDDMEIEFNENEPQIEIDLMIKDIEQIEKEIKQAINMEMDDTAESHLDRESLIFSDTEEFILNEIEEDLFDLLDILMFENYEKDESESEFISETKEGLEDIIGKIYSQWKDVPKDKFKKRLIMDMINAYGLYKVKNKARLIADILGESREQIHFDIDEVYYLSEEKRLSDYREWYKRELYKEGKKLEISNQL